MFFLQSSEHAKGFVISDIWKAKNITAASIYFFLKNLKLSFEFMNIFEQLYNDQYKSTIFSFFDTMKYSSSKFIVYLNKESTRYQIFFRTSDITISLNH